MENNSKIKKLKHENIILKEQLNMFLKKNKRIWKYDKNYEKILNNKDQSKISFATVLFAFEYAFLFQKLFEMFVYDFIVDKQDPDTKTDEDDKKLIQICKNWTSEIIRNQTYKTSLNVKGFKVAFRLFTGPYLETKSKNLR